MTITGKKIDRHLESDFSSVNQLKVSNEEFNALNRCEKEVKYNYVMKRIADTETLWTMLIDEKTIAVLSHDEKNFFSVWSSKEYGLAFCKNLNAEYRCLPISLDEFVEYFIDFICEEDLFMNVFPTINDPLGKVVNINEFAERLGEELEDYQ